MEYGYQGLDPGSKVQYLLNGIRCNKLSTAVATVRAHPEKYEKNFNAVIAFFNQYIEKKAPKPSVKITSVGQNRLTKCKRQALPMVLSKEKLSWRITPERNMTQYQWHSTTSYMSFRKSWAH